MQITYSTNQKSGNADKFWLRYNISIWCDGIFYTAQGLLREWRDFILYDYDWRPTKDTDSIECEVKHTGHYSNHRLFIFYLDKVAKCAKLTDDGVQSIDVCLETIRSHFVKKYKNIL